MIRIHKSHIFFVSHEDTYAFNVAAASCRDWSWTLQLLGVLPLRRLKVEPWKIRMGNHGWLVCGKSSVLMAQFRLVKYDNLPRS